MSLLTNRLGRYVGVQYLISFFGIMAVLLALVSFIEAAELLRRAADKQDVTFILILEMTILKLPETGQRLMPFVVLFGALITFWRLTRRHEIVVMRAAGVSVWQFAGPVAFVTALMGVFNLLMGQPLSAMMVGQYQKMESVYLQRTSTLDVNDNGLWLRETRPGGAWLIHAASVTPEPIRLLGVLALRLDMREQMVERIDAEEAALDHGSWHFLQALHHPGPGAGKRVARLDLPTDLTIPKIESSLAAPDTLSIWRLPAFIHALQMTGFSITRHALKLQSLFAEPFFLVAMVFWAAAFTQRLQRSGGTLVMLAGGAVTGLVLYVLQNASAALGTAESVPVALAAWSIPLAALMLSLAALLHREDG